MTTINPASTATGAGSVSNALDKTEIAGNFTTFLQLLTTQLKNQNPLDPLDTNQFTQQLVQFAQVEQQMKSNDQLSSLVSLKKSAQATTALAYVGATVVGDGSTAQLTGGNANWSLTSPSRRQLQSLSRIRPVRTSIPAHCSQSRHAEFHLERPRQRRPSLARRRLYPHRHGSRHQQAIGCHFRGTGDRRFCRSHAGPAAAVDQWTELHARQDQADCPADHMIAEWQGVRCWPSIITGC